MARLPTVRAEMIICAATPFLRGEGTATAARTVNVHGTSPRRIGWSGTAGGRKSTLHLLLLLLLLRLKMLLLLLLLRLLLLLLKLLLLLLRVLLLVWMVRPTLDGGCEVVLDSDGFSDVRLKTGRHISPGRNLETNCLF